MGLVGGTIETLENESKFHYQILTPPESKTTVRLIGDATTLLIFEGRYHMSYGEEAGATLADTSSGDKCGIEWDH